MSTEQKNRVKPSNSRTPGMRLNALVLSLSIFGLMLTGCASKPNVIAPNCPEPTPIPAHLSESDSPAVQSYLQKVRAYLAKVQNYLSESQESTTP